MDRETETVINRLMSDLKAAQDLSEYLTENNEKLRKALRFYADMENYIQVDQSTVFVPIITVDLQPQLDNGRTARAALGEGG